MLSKKRVFSLSSLYFKKKKKFRCKKLLNPKILSKAAWVWSRVYIWMRTTHVEVRWGRLYGTFVLYSAFTEAANRSYINVLNASSLWSTDSWGIAFGYLPHSWMLFAWPLQHVYIKPVIHKRQRHAEEHHGILGAPQCAPSHTEECFSVSIQFLRDAVLSILCMRRGIPWAWHTLIYRQPMVRIVAASEACGSVHCAVYTNWG